MRCNEIAARIHADMCRDNDNGYSWEPRHGEDGKGVKTLTIDGKKYSYDRGSWDCSSSVIKAWQLAIQYTPYKGKLDGATFTGNMREVFTRSGLFVVWNTDTTTAQVGDVYLEDESHTAMCQSVTPDLLSEFCINENGEVYNGKPGDQTGREAYIHGWYDYPWSCTLHYNGKADTMPKFTDGTYTATANLYVRDKRAKSGKLLCTIAKGASISLDSFATNKAGNTWARISSGDHKGRYVCVRNKTGDKVKKK